MNCVNPLRKLSVDLSMSVGYVACGRQLGSWKGRQWVEVDVVEGANGEER